MSETTTQLLKSTLLGLTCLVFSTASYATFIGQSVDFTFTETGFSDEVTNNITVINPGFELSGFDTAGIGNAIMFDDEYIDIAAHSITFGLLGGAGTAVDGFQTTGLGDDATYRIDFEQQVLALFEISSASDLILDLDGIIGVALGTELVVGLDFITLNVGTLGIDADLDFGTVTLSAIPTGIPPVPIPPTLPLMLSGLLLVGYLARRKKA